MVDQLDRPHFTERFRTLDAVRAADRVAASVVRHRLDKARGGVRTLLGNDWRLVSVRSGFADHCRGAGLDRYTLERLRRVERTAAAMRAAGADEAGIDAAARRTAHAERDEELRGLPAKAAGESRSGAARPVPA